MRSELNEAYRQLERQLAANLVQALKAEKAAAEAHTAVQKAKALLLALRSVER